MNISPSNTMRQRHALSTVKPGSAPVVLCWATTTGMPVRSLRIVRNHEMKLGVCQT